MTALRPLDITQLLAEEENQLLTVMRIHSTSNRERITGTNSLTEEDR